jgi:hypothetical protein
MKSPGPVPSVLLVYAVMALCLAVYAVVRVNNLSQAVQKVKSTADTTSYVRISKEPVFGARFLAGSRPFVFPLAVKMLGGNEEKVAWTQGIFSILSWSFLAVAVAYSLHAPLLRVAALGWILLLSLYRYIIGWDSVLLTESLSLSLMALFLAGWLWLLHGWRWRKVALLLLVALLWTFSRDTNAWVVLMISIFLLLLAGVRIIDKKYLVLSLALLGMFYASNLTSDLGERWVFPFQNVLGQRILLHPQSVDFFARCGMPVSPALMNLAGEYARGEDRAFYQDPALAGYRSWLSESGKRCYMKWLWSGPLESLKGPIAEFNTLITLKDIQPFLFSRKFSPILPGRFEAILYPPQPGIIYAIVSGLVLLAVYMKAWTRNKMWWVAIVLTLLVFPHYFIIWHGDVMGIDRHVLSVSIQLYLGLWIFVLLVLDSVVSLGTVPAGLLNKLSFGAAKQ